MDDEGARHVADLEQELAALRPRLALEQQHLESTRARLQEFERIYARTIGVRLEQLGALEGGGTPDGAGAGLADPQPAFAVGVREGPHDELQRLYRQTAQRVHPDLAQDAGERVLRTRVMAEFNAAREAHDLDRAHQLLEDWEVRPRTIVRDSATARAAHLVRTIQRARTRLVAVAEEHDRLRRSNLHVLMRIVEAQRRAGVDMLAETAADLDQQLAAARVAAAAPVTPESMASIAPAQPARTLAARIHARALAAPATPRTVSIPTPPAASAKPYWLWGAAAVTLIFVGAVGASLRWAQPGAVVLLPSTAERQTSAVIAPPAASTLPPLAYRVIDRTTSAVGRSQTALSIVIDAASSPAEAVSTLAAAARRELKSSQAVVIYAYRSATEVSGPFTVGRAYLSVDGRGWSGNGLTEDGADDGGIVGSVVTAVGGSIDTSPFRVAR